MSYIAFLLFFYFCYFFCVVDAFCSLFFQLFTYLNHFLLFRFPCAHTNHTVFEMFRSFFRAIIIAVTLRYLPWIFLYRILAVTAQHWLICCRTPVSLRSMLLYFAHCFQCIKILAGKIHGRIGIWGTKRTSKKKKSEFPKHVYCYFCIKLLKFFGPKKKQWKNVTHKRTRTTTMLNWIE